MPEPARIIRWEEVPPHRGNPNPTIHATRSRWEQVAVELIVNQGRSAVIEEASSRSTLDNLAVRIRRGHYGCFAPAGDFDAAVRTIRGVHCLYAWYIGGGNA